MEAGNIAKFAKVFTCESFWLYGNFIVLSLTYITPSSFSIALLLESPCFIFCYSSPTVNSFLFLSLQSLRLLVFAVREGVALCIICDSGPSLVDIGMTIDSYWSGVFDTLEGLSLSRDMAILCFRETKKESY